ncbi:hypothetical protein PHYPO_G00149180, partial [Pangasianodon hypophthalmus]
GVESDSSRNTHTHTHTQRAHTLSHTHTHTQRAHRKEEGNSAVVTPLAPVAEDGKVSASLSLSLSSGVWRKRLGSVSSLSLSLSPCEPTRNRSAPVSRSRARGLKPHG